MSNIEVKKFHRILEELPEMSTIYSQIEKKLKNDSNNSKGEFSATKILEEIIDNNSSITELELDMNFYPAEEGSPCKELCVGIATKGFGLKYDKKRFRTGFTGLIKEIIGYWISCEKVNRKTILFTTEWRDNEFNENWKTIIDRYKAKGKEVKIIEVWQDNFIIRYR